MKDIGIESFVGKTFTRVEMNNNRDEIFFETAEGEVFKMYHAQDCCENVEVEDVVGDLSDLVGSPILTAREDSNNDDPENKYESCTWTFYNLATAKGYVTIRWLGTSNGYYSESVSLVQQWAE